MCHGKDYTPIIRYSFSSNVFKGVCCKPGSSDQLCNGSQIDCSMNSIGSDGGKYSSVLTGNLNYQMFSYCPGLPQSTCGMPLG